VLFCLNLSIHLSRVVLCSWSLGQTRDNYQGLWLRIRVKSSCVTKLLISKLWEDGMWKRDFRVSVL
jgi:hypothetical protein